MEDLIKEKIQFDNDRKIVKEWKASKPQYVKDSEKELLLFKLSLETVNPLLKESEREENRNCKRKIHLFDGVEYEMTQSKKLQLQTVYRNVAFGSTLIEPQKATNRIDIR